MGARAKVLNLFRREIVVESRRFSEEDVERLTPWLYIPIDRIVIKNLRDCGIELDFKAIKDIDTRKKFHHVQEDILVYCPTNRWTIGGSSVYAWACPENFPL